MNSFQTISIQQLIQRGIDITLDRVQSNYGYLLDEDDHSYTVACINPLIPLTNIDEYKLKPIKLIKIIREERKTINKDLPFSDNFIFLQENNAMDALKKLLKTAIERNASDVHLDMQESKLIIRLRIHGDLQVLGLLNLSLGEQIINTIKVLSNIDITVTRHPQDGKLAIVTDDTRIQCRCATLPTQYGEKIVLRILDANQQYRFIRDLNIPESLENEIKKVLHMRSGAIIFSGPTGSGKSTTMYALLREINRPELNIITVEDPIEYQVEGINQVEVNQKAGITFESVLRAVLRVDPDVLLIGETRDSKTADLMVGSGITGHLVMSTIHASDCIGTINRLLDMGIEPYKINGGVKYIISQRVVKRLCKHCKVKTTSMIQNSLRKTYKAVGCKFCENGYSSRFAIYELLKIDDELRNLIIQSQTTQINRKDFKKYVLNVLEEQANFLLEQGIIDEKEFLKLILSLD